MQKLYVMQPAQEHDSAVSFEPTQIKTFQSLRLRYDIIRVTVGNFLQRIQIKRKPPVVVSSTSAQIVHPAVPMRGPEIPKSLQPKNDYERRSVVEIDGGHTSTAPIQGVRNRRPRNRDLDSYNHARPALLDQQPPPATETSQRRKPRERPRPDLPVTSPEGIVTKPIIVPDSVKPNSPPVLKLRTPRSSEEPTNVPRVRRRRSPRTVRHDRRHPDTNNAAEMGDSDPSVGSGSSGSNDALSKKHVQEVTAISSLNSGSSEVDIDREESIKTVKLHSRPGNTNVTSTKKEVKPGYLVAIKPVPVSVESVTELDEADLSRIPMLKLRHKSVGFHRTALQRLSSSIINIPSATRHIFRIRRRAPPKTEPPFARSTVNREEAEPSHFIFSMLDLKKRREEQARQDVAVGMGLIFRRESIRENRRKRMEDDDEVLGCFPIRRRAERANPSPYPGSNIKPRFVKPQLPLGEALPESNRYLQHHSQTPRQNVFLKPPLPVKHTDFDPRAPPTLTELNRILATYSRPDPEPILTHPLSPLYTRPAFQSTIPEMVPVKLAAAKAKKEAAEAVAAKNYYPRTSFTAQFAHLLPQARRGDEHS